MDTYVAHLVRGARQRRRPIYLGRNVSCRSLEAAKVMRWPGRDLIFKEKMLMHVLSSLLKEEIRGVSPSLITIHISYPFTLSSYSFCCIILESVGQAHFPGMLSLSFETSSLILLFHTA